jgi:AraC-like DNA-binding protein
VDHRFDSWWELISQTRASDVISAHSDDFWAEYRLMELGPVAVWSASFLPTRFRRSPKMVRQCDPEMYHLTLVQEGRLAVDHAGRIDTFGPGDLHLADSSRPYDVRSTDSRESAAVKGVAVDFPKRLLPLPDYRVRELLGRGLHGQEGVGALLSNFLVGLDQHADSLQASDAPRLGTVMLELISAWFAQVLDAEDALSHGSRPAVSVEAIRAFIRQNLHDPDLSPPAVAGAHHISLSYLHRIFQRHGQGESVSAYIRRQRLKGACRDLADSSLRSTPVHAVAARWGFSRASDFNRAFRTAYDITPTEFRLRALAGQE